MWDPFEYPNGSLGDQANNGHDNQTFGKRSSEREQEMCQCKMV